MERNHLCIPEEQLGVGCVCHVSRDKHSIRRISSVSTHIQQLCLVRYAHQRLKVWLLGISETSIEKTGVEYRTCIYIWQIYTQYQSDKPRKPTRTVLSISMFNVVLRKRTEWIKMGAHEEDNDYARVIQKLQCRWYCSN
jgi:hypothetical protein